MNGGDKMDAVLVGSRIKKLMVKKKITLEQLSNKMQIGLK